MVWGHIWGHMIIHATTSPVNAGFVLPLLAPITFQRQCTETCLRKESPSGDFFCMEFFHAVVMAIAGTTGGNARQASKLVVF
jgi:hypothetical protein